MWCLGFKGIAHLDTFWRRLYFSGSETVYSILNGKKLLGSHGQRADLCGWSRGWLSPGSVLMSRAQRDLLMPGRDTALTSSVRE